MTHLVWEEFAGSPQIQQLLDTRPAFTEGRGCINKPACTSKAIGDVTGGVDLNRAAAKENPTGMSVSPGQSGCRKPNKGDLITWTGLQPRSPGERGTPEAGAPLREAVLPQRRRQRRQQRLRSH